MRSLFQPLSSGRFFSGNRSAWIIYTDHIYRTGENEVKELLPVGSIVRLKGGVKKAAVMGYLQKVSPEDAKAVKGDPSRIISAIPEAGRSEAEKSGDTGTGAAGSAAKTETEHTVVYDYMAVPYPEGFLGKGSIFLFNEENIDEVCFRGYESDESRGFTQLSGMIFDAAWKGLE